MTRFKTAVLLMTALALLFTTACLGDPEEYKKGGSSGEDVSYAFKIGDTEISKTDFFTRYCYTKNSHEKNNGISNWKQQVEGDETLHDILMENCTVSTAFTAWMLSRAGEYDIQIDPAQQESISAYAKEMSDLITDRQREMYGITDESIQTAAEHSAVSGAVFDAYSEELLSGMTDEEKEECICGEYIYIAVYKGENASGESASGESGEEDPALVKVTEAKEALDGGADPKETAEKYSDEYKETSGKPGESVFILRSGKVYPDGGKLDRTLSGAVNSLTAGEISDIIKTDDGYYIFCCVSEKDDEKTGEAELLAVHDRITAEFTEWMEGQEIVYSDLYKDTVKSGR